MAKSIEEIFPEKSAEIIKKLIEISFEYHINIKEVMCIYHKLNKEIYEKNADINNFRIFDPDLEDKTLEMTKEYFKKK